MLPTGLTSYFTRLAKYSPLPSPQTNITDHEFFISPSHLNDYKLNPVNCSRDMDFENAIDNFLIHMMA